MTNGTVPANSVQELAPYFPDPPVLTSVGRNWKGLEAWRIHQPANGHVELPPINAHGLSMQISGSGGMYSRWRGVAQTRKWVPGEVAIVSADQPSVWEWTNPYEEILILLDRDAVADAAAELSEGPFSVMDDLGILDPVFSEVIFQVNAELTAMNAATPMFGESISTVLIARLLKRYSSLRKKGDLCRLDIASHRLRMALEYIDIHLDRELTLQDVAQVANMSTFRFARAFSKAVGRPPHQYLLARRIDRAKDLLRRTSTEIAEISRLVGFSTQSHFGVVFRKTCGMSPGRYRQLVA
jgi:AraC family transcriptional regulator